MFRRFAAIFLALLLLIVVSGCIATQAVSFAPVDSIDPVVDKALTSFSLDLFRRVVKGEAGGNTFVSPISVWLALCMTYNGASGATAMGMAEALHATGLSVEELNQDNAGLMGVLMAADPDVKIAIANSIWMRKGLEAAFEQGFIDRDRQYYAARIEALDFSDDGAAGVINKWVEDNTNGNMKDLIDPPIDPMTVMFLVNAVHFKAPWKQAFREKDTRDGVFITVGGIEAHAKFLFREEGNLGYIDEAVMAARIPYASGRLEMVAILPQQQPLADFIQMLTPDSLDAIVAKCGETPMSLLFPKFRLEYKAELNDALKAMGMEEAFADGADFTNMSKTMGKQLVISKVNHKSCLEVNEEGMEASAAAVVEMAPSAPIPDPRILKFSKPFLYLIRDTKTGAILFIGTMENPA